MLADAYHRIRLDLADELRALDWRGAQARLAACASLGAVGAVLLAFTLHLDDPWWAGISAVSIVQADAHATMARAVERMVGTVIGAAVGLLLAPLVAWHLPFVIACAAVAGLTVYAQERTARSYAVLLGGVTALLVLFGTLQAPGQALHLAVYRSLEVTAGIVAATLVSQILRPATAATAASAGKPGVFGRPIDRELLGYALTGGIAIALIPVIWTGLDLPGVGQTPITAFVVLTALRSDPYLKALARLAGCCLGGLYGILAVRLVADAFIPWLVCLSLGIYLAGFLQHGRGDASYVGHQAAIAIVLAMVTGPSASAVLLPAIDRLVGIVGGIVIVALVVALTGPLQMRFFSKTSSSQP